MKQFNRITLGITLFCFLISPFLYSQETPKTTDNPGILVVTTIHWNPDKKDGSQKEWKAIEKEYHDKVTMKNDLILHSNFLTHYFTADNSEAKAISVYASWGDIEKANDRNTELIMEAWPDKTTRDAFLEKRNSYYSSMHSDEIYTILPGGVSMEEIPDKPMVYYVRLSHVAFPEDGSNEEAKKLNTEFLKNVIYKNQYIKGYYPHRHFWGSDSRDYIEAFAVNSLADIEASFDRNTELINAHWPDETARKVFFDSYGKYFSGWHGDFIYRSVPELAK